MNAAPLAVLKEISMQSKKKCNWKLSQNNFLPRKQALLELNGWVTSLAVSCCTLLTLLSNPLLCTNLLAASSHTWSHVVRDPTAALIFIWPIIWEKFKIVQVYSFCSLAIRDCWCCGVNYSKVNTCTNCCFFTLEMIFTYENISIGVESRYIRARPGKSTVCLNEPLMQDC